MRSLLRRLWNSPTYTTWGSIVANSFSAIVVLPLILTRFSAAEITVWYLMMTFIGLQQVVDVGFSPTFSRTISYLAGGVAIDDIQRPQNIGTGILDQGHLNRVYSTMKSVYSKLGLLWTILLFSVGTLSLQRPISKVQDSTSAWLAWGVVLSVSYVAFRGEQYVSYLMGLNHVAILRRWDTITALLAIITSFVVLYAGGDLLALIIAHQIWQLIRVIRNRWLAHSALDGAMSASPKVSFDKAIFQKIWPSAWRSGVGILMSYGVIQSSGIIYAQVGSSADVASYLLGMRVMQIITLVAMAPFYSKIPVLSKLYGEGRKEEMLQIAQRGMRLSHWAYVVGFTGTTLVATPLLQYIGSNVSFPGTLLWALMGLAYFVERFGAMHIQLYSTTNHITWHIANGVTGTIYLTVSFGLMRLIGAYAFPVGMLAGYLGFYSWFNAIRCYRTFGLRPFGFEKSCSVIPGGFLLAFLIAISLVSVT